MRARPPAVVLLALAACSVQPDTMRTRVRLLTHVPTEPNLLPDGRFEQRPAQKVGDVSLADDPGVPGRAARITSSVRGQVSGLRLQSVDVEPGRRYYLSFLARHSQGFLGTGSAFPYAAARLEWLRDGELLGEPGEHPIRYTLHGFRRITRVVMPPEGADELRVAFYQRGGIMGELPATLEVADASLAPEPEALRFRELAEADELTISIVRKPTDADSATAEQLITVTDATGRDRALDLAFAIAIPDRPVTWHDDVRACREAQPGGIYHNTISADETGRLPMSVYPFGCITTPDRGLAIGVPPDAPCVSHVEYDADARELRLIYHLGLSPLTDPPSEAHLRAVVFEFDPEWGFRAALARYQQLYPEAFAVRTVFGEELRTVGNVYYKSPREDADERFRFGLMQNGMIWREAAAKRAYDFQRRAGLFLALYTLPWADEPGSSSSDGPPPPYDRTLAERDERLERPGLYGDAQRAAIECALTETNGDVCVSQQMVASSRPDTWTARLPLNCDPEIPDGRGQTYLRWIRTAFELADRFDGRLHSVQMDNFFAEGCFHDYTRERFALADLPLSYSPNTFQVGVPVFCTYVEYLRELQAWLAAERPDSMMSANCIAEGPASFGFPFLGFLPFECTEPRFNWGDAEFSYRRAMAGRRPAAAVDCFSFRDEPTEGEVVAHAEHFMDVCLLYGFYPYLAKFLQRAGNPDAGAELHERYWPILDALNEAGWEPITSARCEDPRIAMERFGPRDGGPAFLTVRNTGDAPADARLVLDAEALGAVGAATELLTGERVPLIDGGLRLSVPPQTTRALRLE